MNAEERRAALNRLAAFVDQEITADKKADEGSLDRAADIVALYEDKGWVDEVPAPKTRRSRGRPVDPESFSRFSRWLTEKTSLRGSRAYQLRDAHLIRSNYFHQVEIKPRGERELRPLKWLTKHDYAAAVPEVWSTAVELAGGRPPDAPTVRKALSQWKHDHLPKVEGKSTAARGGHALAERIKRDAERLMLEYPDLFVPTIDAIEASAEAFVNKALAA